MNHVVIDPTWNHLVLHYQCRLLIGPQYHQHLLFQCCVISNSFESSRVHATHHTVDKEAWYDFNDASVSPVAKERAQSNSAYLLFYELRQ